MRKVTSPQASSPMDYYHLTLLTCRKFASGHGRRGHGADCLRDKIDESVCLQGLSPNTSLTGYQQARAGGFCLAIVVLVHLSGLDIGALPHNVRVLGMGCRSASGHRDRTSQGGVTEAICGHPVFGYGRLTKAIVAGI